MLNCDICGEQLLLEEDMMTHLLLSHAENELSCPLCCLSGVSYDELSYHIGTAHPENRDACGPNPGPSDSSGSSGATGSTVPRGQYRGASTSSQHRRACDRATDVQRATVTAATVAHQESGGNSSAWTTSSLATKPQEPVEHCEGNDKGSGRNTSKPSGAKHKTRSSPVKENTFSCPMCALVCSSSVILQEHVELHLQEQSPSKAGSHECPMCPVVYQDSASLQQHVWLHLDEGTAGNTGGPGGDHRLASRLQREEEQRKRWQETKQEEKEFKILQRRYGMDGSGGYRRQVERTMEREVSRGLLTPADFHSRRADVMEALATGVDDGSTRTQGILESLYNYHQTEAKDCVRVWLSAETDHYCSSVGDRGWGCGYRNFQMLLSALHKMDAFAECLQPDGAIPSVPRIQAMMEGAWREGLDPQGASHFSRRLQGTRAWIGATEIYTLLTSLGVRARILDFHRPTGPGSTHPRLFEWARSYFSGGGAGGTGGGGLGPPRVIRTHRPPLYLQHQGHSRTVVGVAERDKGSLCLLVLDPGCSAADIRKLLCSDGAPAPTSAAVAAAAVRQVRKLPSQLKHSQYQVVAADGVLSAGERQTRILESSVLQAERIP